MNTVINKGRFGPVMLDVVGEKLTQQDIDRIKHPYTGGVILFSRNYTDRAQLIALTEAIHNIRQDILIAVDHEGGRVQRFKTDGFTHLPAMQKLGEAYKKNEVLAGRIALSCGFVLASELRACGVDFSFTPVLDLDYGVSAVIGNRSFSDDPHIVSYLSERLNHGLLLAGMANCGKHFPGHGFATGDSHTEIPVDERKLDEIMAQDVLPYRALAMGLTSVMPAHVIYTQVDSQPAGFSKKWLTILRSQVGFNGMIFSDDLSMQGASVAGDILARAHAAFSAGCDMVLVCNAPEQADKLLAGLEQLPDQFLEQTATRLSRLMPRGSAKTWNELMQDADYIQAKNIISSLQ